MKNLIFASSKPWHKKGFDKFKKKFNFNCYYVSTSKELQSIIKKKNNFQYLFFLHWNWKISSQIYKKYECICFHMTDLPYGRGGSPLQNLISHKKKKTKISAFRMIKKLDAGPIYLKKSMTLDGRAEEIYERAGNICWQIINWIIKYRPNPEPQKNKPTYFNRRKPEQSLLPRKGKLSEINDFIRMLDAPTYPLAFIDYGDFKLELSYPKLVDNMVEARIVIKKKK